MGQFLGTYQNRLDAKGRVSIPAGFRTILRAAQQEGQHQLVLRPAHQSDSVEGWPGVTYSEFDKRVDGLDTYGDEQSMLLFMLFATAVPVESDREGRIILPEHLIAHANLKDTVSFVGFGRRFEIWEPSKLADVIADATARARREKLTVPRPAREPVA